MKRTLLRTTVLMLALTLCLAPLCCRADFGAVCRVQSKSPVGFTYVYSRPTSSGDCLGRLDDGTYVTAFQTERGEGDTGSLWYYCAGPNGVKGYIRSDNLEAVPSRACAEKYVVRSVHPEGFTYMYSKPTSGGSLVGTYPDGTAVSVYYSEKGQGDQSSTWYYCMGPDGALGYIRSNNLAKCR